MNQNLSYTNSRIDESSLNGIESECSSSVSEDPVHAFAGQSAYDFYTHDRIAPVVNAAYGTGEQPKKQHENHEISGKGMESKGGGLRP